MAVLTTKAIVLSAIKYGDSSLIVKCLTKASGVKTFMVKGVLKAKKGKFKPSYFQVLTQLEVTFSNSTKGSLYSLKEVQVINPYFSIPLSISKQTIVLFLSEILSTIIQEEEENQPLYSYIEAALIWLDTHDTISNFHLLFLLNLTKFLGFYPDITNSERNAFNLIEGRFVYHSTEGLCLTDEKLELFKRLLGINFDAINTILFNKNQRQTILKFIIQYFELHLEGFKKPKSLAVLETVFN